jgi:carbamoyltransferase
VERVKPEKQNEIPAVIYVDGTPRPQSVSNDATPRFYYLMKEFWKLTGVPAIFNTSFNVTGGTHHKQPW